MKAAERTLFFSLWGVLLLGLAIWRFWPAEPKPVEDPHPGVILADELINWFDRAKVVEQTPTRYRIEVTIRPSYLEKLRGETGRIQLGFHLRSENLVLSQGVVECVVQPEGKITVDIPNPNRVSARTVQLTLAH